MKAYYAHCKALYDTPQEVRDLKLLRTLFADNFVNPNNRQVDADLQRLRDAHASYPQSLYVSTMDYFEKFADECDIIVFRALPDGRIPSGVAQEIQWFRQRGKPVLELPSNILSRVMSLDATREYLTEVGER